MKKRGLTGEQLRCIMWGRESISTPIKVKGRVIDPTKLATDPSNPMGGFGTALTSALDVMAFTNDLDIAGVNPAGVPNTGQAVNMGFTVPVSRISLNGLRGIVR